MKRYTKVGARNKASELVSAGWTLMDERDDCLWLHRVSDDGKERFVYLYYLKKRKCHKCNQYRIKGSRKLVRWFCEECLRKK